MRDDATTVLAGRRVPRLGFGLARQSIGAVVDDAAATRLIDLALDRGLRYLALARRGDAADVLLATTSGPYRDGDQWLYEQSAAIRREAAELA